jgi:hypothetical protein
VKREYNVRIVVDDSATTQTSQCLHDGEKEFIVNIRPSPCGSALPDLMAHELGHVIQGIFKTPSHQADPRVSSNLGSDIYKMYKVFGVPENHAKAMFDNEEEAWQYARKIWPGVSKKCMEYGLGSYYRAWKG